jgi:hypothetical protein
MNEKEWHNGIGTKWMLEHVRGRASPRQLRLFACASVRRLGSVLQEAGLRAVEAAEAFADGRDSHEQALSSSSLAAGLLGAGPVKGVQGDAIRALEYMVANDPWDAAHAYVWVVARHNGMPSAREAELAAQCHLLRDIFGNPFRPVTPQPAWLTPTVTDLARAAYEDRLPAGTLDPARLAVLGDALEESGCCDTDLLNHCRQPGPHLLGCWLIELLLGGNATRAKLNEPA